MFITALCPTYRHPNLLASSLAMWEHQDYPLDRRRLVILDDDPTFDSQEGPGWELHAAQERLPSITAKYNHLLSLAPRDTDAFLVWEDDDMYFPGYVSAYAKVLHSHELCKPDTVLSDYAYPQTGKFQLEGAKGMFHSSLGFREDLIDRVGGSWDPGQLGWPPTDRADFDQMLQNRLHQEASSVASPWPRNASGEFIYHWHTDSAHCQSTMDQGADDETWYDRGEKAYARVPFEGKLIASLSDKMRSWVGMYHRGELDWTVKS